LLFTSIFQTCKPDYAEASITNQSQAFNMHIINLLHQFEPR